MPVSALKGLMMRAPMISLFAVGGIVALGCLLPLPASAQDPTPRPAVQNASIKPIGKVVSAKGAVTVEHVNAVVVQAALGSNSGQTKIGDPIYLGDIVQTGADGRLGITFADGTAFDLSSNARMVMTEFIYDPNSQTNSTLLSLTKGQFTFVAGKIAKSGDMKIDTPVATMGIRGTTPHVEISDDGTVKFSTLIDEGKQQVMERYGAATTVAPRPGGSAPDAGATAPRKKLNLEICRACQLRPVAASGADLSMGRIASRQSVNEFAGPDISMKFCVTRN